MVKDETMLPTNDYVFARIFGHVGNEEITKGLLSAILKKKINSVDLSGNKILERDLQDDKMRSARCKSRLR